MITQPFYQYVGPCRHLVKGFGFTLSHLFLPSQLGFFNRQKQREEEEEQVANGKMPEER
jgi:hypothetical protein